MYAHSIIYGLGESLVVMVILALISGVHIGLVDTNYVW